MNFDQFNFHPHVRAGIQGAGYTTPTPIQDQAIQPILDGRDLLGLAQTGTGKTAAFVLPIIQRLLNGPRGKLRTLILSPTRELAEQTHDAIKQLGRQAKVRSLTVYGGVSAGTTDQRPARRCRNRRCLPGSPLGLDEPESRQPQFD